MNKQMNKAPLPAVTHLLSLWLPRWATEFLFKLVQHMCSQLSFLYALDFCYSANYGPWMAK